MESNKVRAKRSEYSESLKYLGSIITLILSKVCWLDKNSINNADRTMKEFNINRALHTKAGELGLCLPIKDGGRRIILAEDCVDLHRVVIHWCRL